MNKFQATTAVAGLALVAAFQTAGPAQAQNLDLGGAMDAEGYAVLENCVNENPEDPKACIKEELEVLVPQQMEEQLDAAAAMGLSFPPDVLEMIECVMDEVPSLISEHYEINMKVYENGNNMGAIIAGDQADFDALKAFTAATLNVANDCLPAGEPKQDLNEAMEAMDFARSQMVPN